MSEQTIFTSLVVGWFAFAVVIFPVLFFVPVPYGRHKQKGKSVIPDQLSPERRALLPGIW